MIALNHHQHRFRNFTKLFPKANIYIILIYLQKLLIGKDLNINFSFFDFVSLYQRFNILVSSFFLNYFYLCFFDVSLYFDSKYFSELH